MKNPKLNIQTKSLAQNPKQPVPSRFILNVVLFLFQLAYLWSVHHVGVYNVDYFSHFLGFHEQMIMPVVDILIVSNELFPKIFANSYIGKFITKFPKYNLAIYVVFSLVSFITCPAASFWTCFITVFEELAIGYVFHGLLLDKKHGYKKSISFYNKIVEFIKNL